MQSNAESLKIPLFPLGTTLYPDGIIALKIFEVRYLNMVKTCLRQASPFGVVTLDQGSEVRVAGEQVDFHETGTLATIVHFDAVQPNLFMIRGQGGQRFHILHRELASNGLWWADIKLIAADEEIAIPFELQPSAMALKKIIDTINTQQIPDDEQPFLKPYRLNDCAWVANRCAELLDLPAAQKQHLLTMENPRLRLDMIQDILEDMGLFKDQTN
jgi:Lon protease-like protein